MATIAWTEKALSSLDQRDLFSRVAIRKEFARDPRKDAIAIALDPKRRQFATPVSDKRITVVWTHNTETGDITVDSLVTVPYSSEAQIQAACLAESGELSKLA